MLRMNNRGQDESVYLILESQKYLRKHGLSVQIVDKTKNRSLSELDVRWSKGIVPTAIGGGVGAVVV